MWDQGSIGKEPLTIYLQVLIFIVGDHEARRTVLSLCVFLELPPSSAGATAWIQGHRATDHDLDDPPELLHLPGPEAQDLCLPRSHPVGPQSPGGIGGKGAGPSCRILVVDSIGITMDEIRDCVAAALRIFRHLITD